MSFLDEPPIHVSPWPVSGEWDQDRECSRCGGFIPAKWRHFMRPCSCTYMPTDRPPHAPDPDCIACEGSGFLPCEPQDLSVLRMSGACEECGAWSSVLIGEGGQIEGSAHHYDDVADHEVVVGSAPLMRSIDETLTRERPPEST